MELHFTHKEVFGRDCYYGHNKPALALARMLRQLGRKSLTRGDINDLMDGGFDILIVEDAQTPS